MKVELDKFPDDRLVLSLGDGGMECDLVFAESATVPEDPLYAKQREMLEYIVDACEKYDG